MASPHGPPFRFRSFQDPAPHPPSKSRIGKAQPEIVADSRLCELMLHIQMEYMVFMYTVQSSYMYIYIYIYILSILLHTDCPSCSTTFACKRILLRKLVEKAKVKTKPPEKPADDHRTVCSAKRFQFKGWL